MHLEARLYVAGPDSSGLEKSLDTEITDSYSKVEGMHSNYLGPKVENEKRVLDQLH